MRDALTNSLYTISTYADRDDFVNNYLDYCVFSSSEALDSTDESSPFYIKYGYLYNSNNEIIKDSSVTVEENVQKSQIKRINNGQTKIKIRFDIIKINNIPINMLGTNTFYAFSNNLKSLINRTFTFDEFYNLTKCMISISKICYKKNRSDYSISELGFPNLNDMTFNFASSGHFNISFSSNTEILPSEENESYYIVKFYKNGSAVMYSSTNRELSNNCSLYKPYQSTTKLTLNYTLSKIKTSEDRSYLIDGYVREVYNSSTISLSYPATRAIEYPISAESKTYTITYKGSETVRYAIEYSIDISSWKSFIWLIDSQFNISYSTGSDKFYIVPHRLLIDYSKFQHDYYYIDFDNKLLKIVIYGDIRNHETPYDPDTVIKFNILYINSSSANKLQGASLVDTFSSIYKTANDYYDYDDGTYFPYFVSDDSLNKFTDTKMKYIMYKYPKVVLENQCDSGFTKTEYLDTSNRLVFIQDNPYMIFEIPRRHMSFMIFKRGRLLIPDFYVIGAHSSITLEDGTIVQIFNNEKNRLTFSDDGTIYIYVSLDKIGLNNPDADYSGIIELKDTIYIVAINAFFDENVFYPTKKRIRIFDGTGLSIVNNSVTISNPSSVFPGYNSTEEETFNLVTRNNSVVRYTKKDESVYVEDAIGSYIAAIMNNEYSFPYNKDLTINNSQARIQMPDSDIDADIIGEQDPVTGSYFIADQYGPYSKLAKFSDDDISEFSFKYILSNWQYDDTDIKTVTETSGGISITHKYKKITNYDDNNWYINVDNDNINIIIRYSKTLNNVLNTPLKTVFNKYTPDTVFINENAYEEFLNNGGKEIADAFSPENKNVSIYVPDVYYEAYNGEFAQILNSDTTNTAYVELSDSWEYDDTDTIEYNDSEYKKITNYSDDYSYIEFKGDEIIKYKKLNNTEYTVLADKTSNAYSNYNFNDINDDFLVYEIPYQLSSYGRKMIVFLDGYFTDEFIVSKKICERLFNGNSLLTFSSSIYDPIRQDYYYYFEEYEYGEYIKDGDEYIIPSEYEEGVTRYKKYVPNVYIATLSSYHLIATLDTVEIKSPEDVTNYGSVISITYDKEFKMNIVDRLHQYHDINIDFFSKGYTLLFINGLYIDSDHIVEIDNQSFGLKDLDYFGFETDANGHYIIKSLFLFEYGDFNYDKINKFYTRYSPEETEALFHGIKRYKVNSTEKAFTALATYDGQNAYCDCGRTVGSDNLDETCPYCLSEVTNHEYSNLGIGDIYVQSDPETVSEDNLLTYSYPPGELEDNINYSVNDDVPQEDIIESIALAEGNRFGLDKLVSEPESITISDDSEEHALYETFAKYVLNTLDIDLNLNLSYEIQSFFKRLYSEDERMPFEYYLELLERKYQY